VVLTWAQIPFAATFADIPELIKAYDIMEALIIQSKGCLLDCFNWKLNCYIVLVHWCSFVVTLNALRKKKILDLTKEIILSAVCNKDLYP